MSIMGIAKQMLVSLYRALRADLQRFALPFIKPERVILDADVCPTKHCQPGSIVTPITRLVWGL